MLTPLTFALATGTWMLLYVAARAAIERLLDSARGVRLVPDARARATLRAQGGSYLLSAIHALFVTPRGVQHLYRLFRAPLSYKLLAPRGAEALAAVAASARLARHAAEVERVMFTNLVLSGYLAADVVFVLAAYPRLGGADIVAHHTAFLFCGLVAGHWRLYPFTFGWLIVGEASTPLLDLRWLLIKVGWGDTWTFTVVQLLFAAVFVLTRFFIYGAGLAYHLSMLTRMPRFIPRWAVYTTTSFVVLGFFLNFMWLSKITSIAMGRSKKRGAAEGQTQDSSAVAQSSGSAAEGHEKDD